MRCWLVQSKVLKAGSTMDAENNVLFNEWLQKAPGWVRVIANSQTAYEAMALAFEAGECSPTINPISEEDMREEFSNETGDSTS